jgi:hypothetical protein
MVTNREKADEEVEVDDEPESPDYVTADDVREIVTEILEGLTAVPGDDVQDGDGDADRADAGAGHITPQQAEQIAEAAVRKALGTVKKSAPRKKAAAKPAPEPEVTPEDPRRFNLRDLIWGK